MIKKIKNIKNIIQLLNVPVCIILLYASSILLLSVYPTKSWETLVLGLILASTGSLATLLLLRQHQMTHPSETTFSSSQTQSIHSTQLKNSPHISHISHSSDSTQTPQSDDQSYESASNFQDLESEIAQLRHSNQDLTEKIKTKIEEINRIEKEVAKLHHNIEDLNHEKESQKTTLEDELKRKNVLLGEYQETINQQRDVIEKKQEQISQLEVKVRDLNYEVKTLLQLNEFNNLTTNTARGNLVGEEPAPYQTLPPPPVTTFQPKREKDRQVKNPEEASNQLHRCLDIAQKITGANHFGNGNSRFRDMPINNYALDLRRLSDSLLSENSAMIIVYSQKEKRLIIANDQTRQLLGWNSDKFTQNFAEIIQEGIKDWNRALHNLSTNPESRARFILKTKSGDSLLVNCHLGVIPSGIFRNYVIGVIYVAENPGVVTLQFKETANN